MELKNWVVRIYGKDDTLIDKWTIDNRTEIEAMNEAMSDVHQISQSNENYDTWTMETYSKSNDNKYANPMKYFQLSMRCGDNSDDGDHDIWIGIDESMELELGPSTCFHTIKPIEFNITPEDAIDIIVKRKDQSNA